MSPGIRRAVACRMAWRVLPFTASIGPGEPFEYLGKWASTHIRSVEKALITAGVFSVVEGDESQDAVEVADKAKAAVEAVASALLAARRNAVAFASVKSSGKAVRFRSNRAYENFQDAIDAADAASEAVSYVTDANFVEAAHNAITANWRLYACALADLRFRSDDPRRLLHLPIWGDSAELPPQLPVYEQQWLSGLNSLGIYGIGERYLKAKVGTLDWEEVQRDVFGELLVPWSNSKSQNSTAQLYCRLGLEGLNEDTLRMLRDPRIKVPVIGRWEQQSQPDDLPDPNPLWLAWRDAQRAGVSK